MTKEELEAIRARCEAATPGPWHRTSGLIQDKTGGVVANVSVSADGMFFVYARTDMPALLAEIDRIERDCRHYCDYIKELEDAHRQAESERDVLAALLNKHSGHPFGASTWTQWATQEVAKRKEKK